MSNEMTTDTNLRQRARELLAAEYERGGHKTIPAMIREGRMFDGMEFTLSAIEAALAQSAQQADADEDAYVIDRLAHLLAEISVIVNGPEPAGTKWSYHDLPEKVRALKTAPAAVPAGEAVAYLDIGVGGYLDLGTEKDADELFKLPPGRHMLGIIGTYGVDGYKANPPAAEAPAPVQAAPQEGEAAAQTLRDALSYVGYRTDGDLSTLAERAELWMRANRVLIDSQRANIDRLKALAHPAAGDKVRVDAPMIERAAKVLSDRCADVCGVDREDEWAFSGSGHRDDARAALEAALAQPHEADRHDR